MFREEVAGDGTSGTNNLSQQGSRHTVPQSTTATVAVNPDEPGASHNSQTQ